MSAARRSWFIGSTAMPGGIPAAVREMTVGFAHDDLGSLRAVLAAGDVACVVMEAATALLEPSPGYLAGVRALCTEHGALMVLDEMITGFRWSARGAQHVYDVVPDLSTWGKGDGQRVPGQCPGRAGRDHGARRARHRRRACVPALDDPRPGVGVAGCLPRGGGTYASRDVVGEMERTGARLAAGLDGISTTAGTFPHVRALGRPSCLVFTSRDAEGQPSQHFRALLLQELLRRGVLGQSLVVSAAHTEADVDLTLRAFEGALAVYRRALDAGTTDGLLRSPPVDPALRRLAEPRRR